MVIAASLPRFSRCGLVLSVAEGALWLCLAAIRGLVPATCPAVPETVRSELALIHGLAEQVI
jgi:hypothetical protein